MKSRIRAIAIAFAATTLLVGVRAEAQSVQLRLGSREALYEGVPFVLALVAEGFDDTPEPAQPTVAIEGCQVTPLGVNPSVFSFTQNINGQVSEVRRVTFTFRYRVDAQSRGRYNIPGITVEQGSKRASTQPAQFTVRQISTTRDMQLRFSIPERPVWVGEVFDAHIDWYLSRDPQNQRFAIPLFDSEDWAKVSPPPGTHGRTLAFQVGSREVQLPYTMQKDVLDGVNYTRFRFHARVTPLRAGALALPPARVVADLQVGTTRDRFGFSRAKTSAFKAIDKPRTLEVRAPPMKDRPASFANAIGSRFAIDVQASNTVVKVGEPVELQVTIRTNSPLEGLSLPELDKGGGLPNDLFDVADEPPAGEILDDGKSKLFRVTIRPKSAEASLIPPIAFSYFNPEKAAYETIHSREIALSVQGSSVVGAGQVVSGNGGGASPSTPPPTTANRSLALVGAELSLSPERDTLRSVLSLSDVRPLLYVLYLLPLLLLSVRVWQVRTGARRGKQNQVRRCLRAVERELSEAVRTPARDAAPRILSALKALARSVGRPAGESVPIIENLDTVAYDPSASSEPLSKSRLEDIRALAREWVDAYGAEASRRPASAPVVGLLFVASTLTASGNTALADTADREGALQAARAAYAEALSEEGDRDTRARTFARAEALFRELVAAAPDRPELLADWGNAALGARDYGRATLAYRRALLFDAGNERARRGLAQLRQAAPAWLPRAESGGALDTLFFWHHRLSTAHRHLLGAASFAIAILLLVPWGRRSRLRRRLALIPALFWIAMTTSVLFQRDAAADVVVIDDGVVLRSADSAGAPPALSQPLPSGAEARALESRESWTRIGLADGTAGWVPSRTVEHVKP